MGHERSNEDIENDATHVEQSARKIRAVAREVGYQSPACGGMQASMVEGRLGTMIRMGNMVKY